MDGFKPRITRINGLSDRRRLPRLGKIRLGVKAISKNTGKEYPKETDHFVVPPEVARIYGDQPKVLDVMFPVNDEGVVFPQAYKYYGSSKGLKCQGDGCKAYEAQDDGTIKERACPCERMKSEANPRGECTQRANLMVILPKVSLGGIYQIDMGSYNSIVDLNSSIEYVRALVMQTLGLDRFAMIPLKLKREPRETHHDGKKQTHYTLSLELNMNIDQLNALRQDPKIVAPPQLALPPAEEINPAQDDGAVIEYVDDEEDSKPEHQERPVGDPAVAQEADALFDAIRPGGESTEEVGRQKREDSPDDVVKANRQKVAMAFSRWAAEHGLAAPQAEKLRHTWVETFFGVAGLTDLSPKDLQKIADAIDGKLKNSKGQNVSADKVAKIKNWIKLQAPLFAEN